MFGVETEYAISGWDRAGLPFPRESLCDYFIATAWESTPHLLDPSGRGLFLPNAARLYLDAGCHPEYATAECRDPWELVAHVRAGERLMERFADRIRSSCPGLGQLAVFRSGYTPGPPAAAWASHESYGCSRRPHRLAGQLIPHLVSRIIYAGAGGLRPGGAGLEFTLSPRAWFLVRARSTRSEGDRGIFHLRDEPLSRGSARLHVISGETLCSDLATVLRAGATALIVALADIGVDLASAVTLAAPVTALRRFAADPGCRVRAPLQSGQSASAIEIQRHYLHGVEPYARILPAWAGAVCALWRSQLDALEADPLAAARTKLDWAIKHALFAQLADQYGARLDRPAARRSRSGQGDRARCRQALLELDMRFGELGERGVFRQLERKGVLEHRQVSIAECDLAMQRPPQRTRARVRGEWISRLAADPALAGRCVCDWAEIIDIHRFRRLDLGHPFATGPVDWTRSDPESRRGGRQLVGDLPF